MTGQCPKCESRITWQQAAFAGKKKPFDCSGCGEKLAKETIRLPIVMMGFAVFWALYLTLGFSLLTVAGWVLIGLAITVDARFKTPIKLSSST